MEDTVSYVTDAFDVTSSGEPKSQLSNSQSDSIGDAASFFGVFDGEYLVRIRTYIGFGGARHHTPKNTSFFFADQYCMRSM